MRFPCLLSIAILLSLPTGILVGQSEPEAAAATATAARDWRLTRYGWQDAGYWSVDIEAMVRPIEDIHPALWAVNILLASLFALVWCSSEIQVARFLGHPIERRKRPRPAGGK